MMRFLVDRDIRDIQHPVPAVSVGLLIVAMITGPAAVAQELPLPIADLKRTEAVDFAGEIMPILKRNCLACHHEKEAEGGLILESLAGIRKGGDSGPGVVAKDVDASLLLTRASGAEEPLMPPEDNTVGAKPLTPEELGLLKLWIAQGAEGTEMTVTESIDWQPIPESIRTVYALDVSPDGQYAAVARGNRVAILDLATHAEVARLVDPSLTVGAVADVDLIQSIAFAPDAQRIATGGFRTVRIWTKTNGQVDPASTPLSGAAGLLAVKADETVAALVNAVGDIELWNLGENKRLHALSGHADRISGLAWAGDSDHVYSCDQSGRLIAWQASSGAKLAEFDAGSPLSKLSASSDGKHVAAIDASRKAQVFRLADDGKSIARLHDAAGGVSDSMAVAFSTKPAPMVIVASEAGGVLLLGQADNKQIRKVDHGAVVASLAVSSDQTRLITGGRDGKARVWNIADGKPGVTLEGQPELRLRIAAASRDALRQKAAVDRLNARTGELEKLLEKENEVLKKATEEHTKAVGALAAEEKKRVDAVAVVKATEGKIAKATADAAKAAEMATAAGKLLEVAKSTAGTVGKEVETKKAELTAAQEALKKAAQQLADITKTKNDMDARVAAIAKQLAEKQAALTKATADAAKAQTDMDSANKMAAEAKTANEKAGKELEAQKKSVAAAEEAKTKGEAEVSKRKQAMDAATSAQKRADAAIPAHKTLIASETRRQGLLDKQLASTQTLVTTAGNQVIDVAVSRDDANIATRHTDGSVRVYRAADGLPIFYRQASDLPGGGRVTMVGDLICGFSDSSPPSLWSRRVGWSLERTIGTIQDPTIISDRVTALDFRQDGMSLAVGSGPPSRSGEVKVFAVESGQLVRDFGAVHSDTVLGLKFSPAGRRVASSAADKTIRLLDIATGKVIRSLEGHTHHVLGVDWQDDGQTIASASADKTIKIWNTETGEQRRTIPGFSKEVTGVAFVQTSNQIITACADGQLRLSDTSNGKAIRTFNASGDFLFALSVTPDGKKLVAGGQSGNVRIWTIADGKLVHETK